MAGKPEFVLQKKTAKKRPLGGRRKSLIWVAES